MPIHIDQIDTEVLAEPESEHAASPPMESATQAARMLEHLARLAEDRRRVAAEGYDD
ncbi:MAG: hypothetical protein KF833_04310 [Verrucomicrobiae bacterium]|nr:hypothetical protein [Verrucomicrobiae bacterium]